MTSPDISSLLVARYSVTIAPPYTFAEGVEIIATEESIGIESIAFSRTMRIFPGITGVSAAIRERHSARVLQMQQTSEQAGVVDIGFPAENLDQEFGIVPIILSTLMGDLFGLEAVAAIRLLEVTWPEALLARFPGPKYGSDGVHNTLNKRGPLLGVIIKPNIGLTPRETGDLVYLLAMAGVDFIKDDELLVSTRECPLRERVCYSTDALTRAAAAGRNTIHAINVSVDPGALLDAARQAVDAGARCLMLNVFVAGFAALKMLAEDPSINVPVHTHRCMHDIFTSRTDYGVRPSVFAQLARLCGADFYHVGTPVGRSSDARAEMLASAAALTAPSQHHRATLPVSSRASVLSIKETYDMFERGPLMVLACGSVYRPPFGLEENIRALRDALDGAVAGVVKETPATRRAVEYLSQWE
jgi:ribulose-bisphosphate carboxylase large chain